MSAYTDKLRAEIADLTLPRWKRDFAACHLETIERISARITADQLIAHEKVAALAWCRANGNPHVPKQLALPPPCLEGLHYVRR